LFTLLREKHKEVALCFTQNERCLNYVQFEQTEFGFAYCDVTEKVTIGNIMLRRLVRMNAWH